MKQRRNGEDMDEQILEFNKIKEQLMEYCYTKKGKEEMAALSPFMEEIKTRAALRETTEAKMMLETLGTPPLTSLENIPEYLHIAKSGGCLSAEQLELIAVSLTAVKRLKDYLNHGKNLNISLPYFEENLDSLEDIRLELNEKIRSGKVDDYATKTLRSLRQDIDRAERKMRDKADAILKSQKDCMSDSFSTTRNGHLCLPVKKECKFRIPGSVIDKSSTGNTLFIEPSTVAALYNELVELRVDEENEVRRILYTLTSLVADTVDTFVQNEQTIEHLDLAFAKGKLSLTLQAIEPQMNMERKIHIKNGRHPFLAKETCIPLNFDIGGNVHGIIITGPNTGGKTVTMKTVGLICLMAQSGLHVPCEEADICFNNQVLCDIGDGQNISENLSTFSAHITNVLRILRKTTKESLVLMDELGSGTDPTEGMGIAIAVLEELRKSGALFLVTTHYPEIKSYANQCEGILNARMTFDRETLRPLYQLEIGAAGESCAFYIAKKLGMPYHMLELASEKAYGHELPKEFKSDEDDPQTLLREKSGSVKKKKSTLQNLEKARSFNLGDSVMVYPDHKIGIVCETANEKGVLRIQMAGQKKIYVNYKRLKLQVKASELYPADYDFSIVFDSVKVRKTRHDMNRKYVEGVTLDVDK